MLFIVFACLNSVSSQTCRNCAQIFKTCNSQWNFCLRSEFFDQQISKNSEHKFSDWPSRSIKRCKNILKELFKQATIVILRFNCAPKRTVYILIFHVNHLLSQKSTEEHNSQSLRFLIWFQNCRVFNCNIILHNVVQFIKRFIFAFTWNLSISIL